MGEMALRQIELPLRGGFGGSLFAPTPKCPPPVASMSGGKRIWMKWKRATPPWADRAAIQALYAESRRLTRDTGVQHSVDHIIPLLHPLVCGLHWAGNMRVIPLAANIAKGNNCDLGLQGELYG